jgi:uncharacterized protein YbaP (TraB family)
MLKNFIRALFLFTLLFISGNVFSQKKPADKYQSVFWEITGNGLKKPSYLFGTMHVSSKMVFHLSDSFYLAMKNVDAVALELNPELWQPQMVELDKMKQNYVTYAHEPASDYLTENSFRIHKYDDELKSAISTEPTVVNSLLYRTYQYKADFEENTFLDLYIYQTGKKLGKRGTGVENYYETEKLVMEAYSDMANEKKKKTIDTDGETMSEINEKMQAAYRRGDLDLMDSLDILTTTSDAFEEKFLYKRNEIQANSIDTILKKSSLFVGVGAAHLPGTRGVIELLRKKGYILRPIKMTDKEAAQKESIDKLKVPVTFSKVKSDDGFFSVDMPGPLFKMTDENQSINRKQYADMSNGSYYMVTRVKTYSSFIGQSQQIVLKKIDSLLYENIPGKILTKKIIIRNGYQGYDITNRTRHGNLQRFNIFVTPYEILIFKMSGNENYVDGPEADHFFSSIQFAENNNNNSVIFSPKQGGFSVKFPQAPDETLNSINTDNMNRWEYEAVDKTNGDDYLILKKSVYNFKFLEEDTFDIKLIEESFRSPDFFERQLQRKLSSFNGYPCLDVKEIMKDSSIVTARYLIKGPHYYVIAVRSKDAKKDFSDYFNSFRFTPYNYKKNSNYADTNRHFSVVTPVAPALDNDYKAALEKAADAMSNSYYASSSENSYWQKEKNAWFQDDSTGEAIGVSVQQYPKYYYKNDSSKYWSADNMSDYYDKGSMVFHSRDSFQENGMRGLKLELRDTGSSRTIYRYLLLKDNYLFNIVTLSDTLNQASNFMISFFTTFSPDQKKLGRSIFTNCIDSFFNDLFSKDSATHAKAEQSIDNINFDEKDVPKIISAIHQLNPSDKDYFDTKSKLIENLGDIKDTTKPVIVDQLRQIYQQTTDTSTFQNEALIALSKHKTSDAIRVFKELALQDPPVFDENREYSNLIGNLQDSLKLSAPLFPEILQLATLDDYKEPITSLLVKLVDSGYINTSQYENYFSKIYFDSKIELKKEQSKEQKDIKNEKKEDGNNSHYHFYNYGYNSHKDELDNYAILLMPFYNNNPNVTKFFDKLLKSTNKKLQLNTALLMIKNKFAVADSILLSLAADDKYRSILYFKLEKIKQLDKFPAKYKTQLDIARSDLIYNKDYDKIDSIVFLSTKPASYYKQSGIVYLFKYRIKKEDDWKIGICGIQPLDPNKINGDDKLTIMTDKKLKDDEPQDEQLQKQLKKILFSSHKSARNFFESEGDYRFKRIADYGN